MRRLPPERIMELLGRLRAPSPSVGPSVSPPGRRPVSVLYGGAHLFHAGSAQKLGRIARGLFEREILGTSDVVALVGEEARPHAEAVIAKVSAKLAREPVEDLRADFEDGYGVRTDAEEDADAERVGQELARGLREGTLPPFVGIRVRALDGLTGGRAARTLERVLSSLLEGSGAQLPPGFVVTLPKVTGPEQVAAFAELLDIAEETFGLAPGSLRLELMIEASSTLITADGRVGLMDLVAAARGRCTSLHLGAYDLTADVGVVARAQSLGHPICRAAREIMLLATAGSGVAVVDGATTLLPIAARSGAGAPPGGSEGDRARIRGAMALHVADVRRALDLGIFQGWDLHPGQLVTRYIALYTFFAEALDDASRRLSAFVASAARATATGTAFDDAATARSLAGFFLRGLAAGALDPEDLASAGLSAEELSRLRG